MVTVVVSDRTKENSATGMASLGPPGATIRERLAWPHDRCRRARRRTPRVDSSTGAESSAVDFVSKWLVARGWNVTLQEVTQGRANVWASRKGRRRHALDAPRHRPAVHRAASATAIKLYGRGACDAKGIAAAMLVAADELAKAGEERVDLLFVVGEEKGSDGARAANHLAATSKFLINGEPTESKLASGAKGSLRVTVRTRGRAAHSAYPHLGESAIEPMLALLPTLDRARRCRRDDVLGDTTVNIGTLRGGTEANIVPASRRSGDHVPSRRRRGADPRADREVGERASRDRVRIVHPGAAFSHDPRVRSRACRVYVGHPAARALGHAAAVRSRVDPRRAHARTSSSSVDELRAAVDSYETIVRSSARAHDRVLEPVIRRRASVARRDPRRHGRRGPGVHPPAREPSVVRARGAGRVRALGGQAVREAARWIGAEPCRAFVAGMTCALRSGSRDAPTSSSRRSTPPRRATSSRRSRAPARLC